jgi:hypothetical protein
VPDRSVELEARLRKRGLEWMNDMLGSDIRGGCATLSGLTRCGRLPKAGRPRWGTASLGLCCLAPLGYKGLKGVAVGAVILEACSCPFHVNCNPGVFPEGPLRENDESIQSVIGSKL